MTDDSHLWTDWLDHSGEGCPLGLGAEVQAELVRANGTTFEMHGQISTGDLGRPSPWWDEDFGRPVRMNTQLMRLPRVLRYRVRRYASASLCMVAALDAAGRYQRPPDAAEGHA